MLYYVMEPVGSILLPTVPKGTDVVITSNVNRFQGIDYDSRSELISERLKLLFEMYMPGHEFKPVAFLEPAKERQLIYWKFRPPYFNNCVSIFRSDGIVSHIKIINNQAPIIFSVKSPKGIVSIIVRIAVAESALRRSILGLKFSRLHEV